MSGALYSRIKNWVTGDTLLAADLNAEFDNILTNLLPLMIDDYSVNVAQMQVQTDPGEVGTESLATTLGGELARLRFEIAEIKGTTYHYTTATTSLNQLSSVLGTSLTANRISAGRTSANSSQPMFLIPDGTAATVKLAGAVTNFVYSIASTQYTISSNVTVTSLTLAPSSNNTCLVDDASLSAQAFSKLVGENGTQITVDTMGSNISALTGSYAAFKTSTEYFIARVASATVLDRVQRGLFFNSADTRLARVAISNNDTITLMKLTWVYANTSGALTVSYTNPRYSGTAPTSPATGDYWYDMVNNIWKTYNSTTWVDATATLVGVCIQDTTGTKAARSFDLFKNYADLNSVECVKDSTTQVISRYVGSQISVYGTTLKFDRDYVRWSTATDFDSGEALATNTEYYFYVKESGNVAISSVAPLDMREDRLGFYHPGETYRCVGYGRTDATGSGTWQEVESFFQTDRSTLVTSLTAAVSNLLPVPYSTQSKQRTFLINCASTASFTQLLPPVSQFIGETLTYVRTDASVANVATIQTYVSTETIVSATAAQVSMTLNTPGESISLRGANSTSWAVVGRYTPASWINFTPVLSTGAVNGTPTTNIAHWRKDGTDLVVEWHYRHTSGGTAGSGEYLITVPNSLTADTTLMPTGIYHSMGMCKFSNDSAGLGGTSVWGYSYLASSTTFGVRMHTQSGGLLSQALAASFSSGTTYALNITSLNFTISARIPIVGWTI